MPTRSGKQFLKKDDSQPAGHGGAAHYHQPAQNFRAGQALKRTRSTSDILSASQAPTRQTEEAPAGKRSRFAPASLMGNSEAKPKEPSNAIDLTLDDESTNEDEGRNFKRVRRSRDDERNRHVEQNAYYAVPDAWAEKRELKERAKSNAVGPRSARNKIHPPRASVMFTLAEARQILDRLGQDIATRTTSPYTLRTGEYIPYPVTASYHLGGMGRYGEDDPQRAEDVFHRIRTVYGKAPPQNQSRTSPLLASEYVFDWGTNHGKSIYDVSRNYIASILASPRLTQLLEESKGLREALKLFACDDPRLAGGWSPMQSNTLSIRTATQSLQGPAPDRASGRASGRSYSSDNFELTTISAMDGSVDKRRPSARHRPKDYRLEFGQYKGSRLHEVPLDYLKKLERDIDKVGKSKALQRAIRDRNDQLGRGDGQLHHTIRKHATKARKA